MVVNTSKSSKDIGSPIGIIGSKELAVFVDAMCCCDWYAAGAWFCLSLRWIKSFAMEPKIISLEDGTCILLQWVGVCCTIAAEHSGTVISTAGVLMDRPMVACSTAPII